MRAIIKERFELRSAKSLAEQRYSYARPTEQALKRLRLQDQVRLMVRQKDPRYAYDDHRAETFWARVVGWEGKDAIVKIEADFEFSNLHGLHHGDYLLVPYGDILLIETMPRD